MRGIILLTFALLIFSGERILSQTTIQFAGQTWDVRSGTGNPGNNNWSSSQSSVWVDDSGHLHLKIRKEGDKWYCSEIVSQQSFGYGEYIFYMASNVEKYDPNVVAAMFTYENDNREIDIEFTNGGFGNVLYKDIPGWYTIQPKPYNSSNQKRFYLNLTEDYSTHKFIWSSANIFFQSYHGHYPQLPSAEHAIQEWTYTGTKNPPAGKERLHFNLYLLGGQAPTDQKEVEFVVNAVFLPVGSLNVALSPIAAINGGAMWRIDNGAWQNSGVTMNKLSNCEHTISFKSSPGWFTPADTVVQILSNGVVNLNVQYQLNTSAFVLSDTEVKVFPNPVSDKLSVSVSQSFEKAHLFIFDQIGRLVFEQANIFSENIVDVSYLTNGIYFLRIISENGTITEKIIVDRN